MAVVHKAQGASCVKCGRRTFLTPAQLEEGFVCPRCGSVNTPLQDEKAKAAKEEEQKELHLECPVCRLDCVVPKERRFKLLCLCPHCDSVFIKPKAVPQPKEPEKAAEPEPPVPAGEAGAPPQPAKAEEKAKAEAKDAIPQQAPEVQAQAASPEPVPAPPPEPPKNKPAPEQLKTLSEYFINGAPDSMEHAAEIISTVNGIADDAINESFLGFHQLALLTRQPLLKDLISTPLFRKLYFNNESLSYEELRPLVDLVFEEDIELRNSLRVNIDDSSFNLVADYIDGYASEKHKLILEQAEVRKLALKAFHRGFGAKLKPVSGPSGSYGRDGSSVRSSFKPAKSELETLFRRESQENRALDALLQDAGLVKKPAAGEGCLLFAAFAFGAPSLLAFFL